MFGEHSSTSVLKYVLRTLGTKVVRRIVQNRSQFLLQRRAQKLLYYMSVVSMQFTCILYAMYYMRRYMQATIIKPDKSHELVSGPIPTTQPTAPQSSEPERLLALGLAPERPFLMGPVSDLGRQSYSNPSNNGTIISHQFSRKFQIHI